MKKKLTALFLAALLLLSLVACAAASASTDLMSGISANKVSTEVDLTGSGAVAVTDFAVRLFQKSMVDGESSLISPISVLCALAMTANGAAGETRAQMESVLGMSVEELNEYLHVYMEQLPEGDKYKLSIANGIWFKDDKNFIVNQEFLQANADYYGAGIYKAPFDKGTCDDINDWVSEHTEKMIDGIVNEIPDDAVMYLINALVFDAEWKTIYNENQVRENTFTSESGEEQQVDFMYGTLREYLEDDLATGFVKPYADGKYAFVAMLPKEGISVAKYVESLSGEHIQTMLAQPRNIEVRTSLPKFEMEYETELSNVLQSMGMYLPFTVGMDGMGTSAFGPIVISKVTHKTYIAVDEKGTKAGAATAVMMEPTSAPLTEEYKAVYLDRPFVYMIVDCETNIPIFIGTVMDV